MPYSSLRDFIDRLAASGRLARVKAAVSPYLEMTEIQTRLLAEGGPAVLFENVTDDDGKKYPMPVLVNLLRTVMAMRPRTVGSAPCQEVVLRGAEIDLAALPIQTCWPGEPSPLITWPLVVTKGPGQRREDGFNLGIYRMQVTGR